MLNHVHSVGYSVNS